MKFGNPGPGLGQAQKCGEVKPVNLFTHANNNVIKYLMSHSWFSINLFYNGKLPISR
jgi:hypothetical protein